MSAKMREALHNILVTATPYASYDGIWPLVIRMAKEALAEKPAQGEACEHGTVPAGMTCEVCYSEWNSGRRGPPHPPLATPTAQPAPAVPDGWGLAAFQHKWEACETQCQCKVCGTVFTAAPEPRP